MFERLRTMLRKEFIQIFRDPRMRAILIAVPVAQVIIFGYAVNTDVRGVRVALFDLDNTPESRELMSAFEGSGTFDIARRLSEETEVAKVLNRGEAKAVFRINRGFGEDVAAGRTGRLQVLLDGTDSNTTSIVMGYTSSIAGAYSQRLIVERLDRSGMGGRAFEPVSTAFRAWFNPNLDSRSYFVPGVIALLLMVISIILSSMAIVREREIGTMEQIMVSPIGRLEFILGKTIPFALIGYFDVGLISLIAVLWFRIPFRGNPLVLFAAAGLYLMSTLGVGLFISTVSKTQQQAMMTAFFFMMPAMLLSGFIYPIANMPEVVQWLTYLNPLRYFLVIIRGLFLKGVGLHVLWPQMAGLAVLGVVLLTLASARFRKTMA